MAVVLLIVAGLVGGTYYLLTRPSSIVSGLPTVTPSKEAVAAFDDKIGKFLGGGAESAEESSTLSLELTEAEATSKLEELAGSAELPLAITNPRVHFRNDRIQAAGDVTVQGISVNVAVEAQVEASDGKPQVTIGKIDVGGIGVPDAVKEQIQDAISGGVDPSKLGNLGINFDQIASADGVLSIIGTKAPQ